MGLGYPTSIITLLDKYQAQPEGPLKDLLKHELIKEADNDKEYSLVVKDYLRLVGGIH